MTQKLNPFSGRQFLDLNGNPYSGAKLFIYDAGTSSKATTTKDLAGTSNHTNPIILNSRGEPADVAGASQAIWQLDASAVKVVLAPAGDTDPPIAAISTWDNIVGINDSSVISQEEWIVGTTPTYISATSFSLVGDQVSDYHVGRRIKTTNAAGTVYSLITAVAYTSLTTVTVVNDSGALDSGLSAVSYSILAADNPSVPGDLTRIRYIRLSKGSDIASAAALPNATDGNYCDVTGTTDITSISTSGRIGTVIKRHFDGALTLTHNATNLILPGYSDILVAPGDEAEFIEYASGSWICVNYRKATGRPTVESMLYPSGSFYLGDGADGSKTVSTSENLATGEYHYTDLTIAAGQTLGVSESSNGGLLIRVTGTVTLPGTSVINLDGKGALGAPAVGATTQGGQGSAATGGGTGGGGGSADATYVGGAGGSSTLRNITLVGGAQSAAAPNGAGGDGVAVSNLMKTIIKAQVGTDLYALSGSGGGSGGVNSGTGAAGGNGGGTVIIIADTIDFQSGAIITCDGAAGADGVDSNGSGGGGGGGTVILVAQHVTNSGTITVTGGAPGADSGSGGIGGTGGAGSSTVITVV